MTVNFRTRRPLDGGQRPGADLGVQPHHVIARGQFVTLLPKRLADHALQGISRHRMRRVALADDQPQARLRRSKLCIRGLCISISISDANNGAPRA